MVLESSLSFRPVDVLVLAAKPGLAYQREHRYGRVPRHENAHVCRRLDDLEVGCPKANDVRHPCTDFVSNNQRNRWLRRCAHSAPRNDIPGIDRHDCGCRFDLSKGVHNTGAVVVSVWVSYSGTFVGVTYTSGILGSPNRPLKGLPPRATGRRMADLITRKQQ
jgi:hypothetical protein